MSSNISTKVLIEKSFQVSWHQILNFTIIYEKQHHTIAYNHQTMQQTAAAVLTI